MKSGIYSPLLLSTLALASPVDLSARQLGGSSTSNELQNGDCRDITFIFARGSTEIGNMGSTVGPPTCSGLKDTFSDTSVACQGVGGAYSADLASNALPDGTTQAALDEATKLFELASSKCPDTKIVAGGYSQGAALIAGSVSKLDDEVKGKVKGVVLYGYTKNQQNDGQIPDYPADQTKVFCNASDGVCGGALVVTAGHLTYTADVDEAVDFLAGTLGDAGAESGSGSASSSGGFGGLSRFSAESSGGDSEGSSEPNGFGGFGGFS